MLNWCHPTRLQNVGARKCEQVWTRDWDTTSGAPSFIFLFFLQFVFSCTIHVVSLLSLASSSMQSCPAGAMVGAAM